MLSVGVFILIGPDTYGREHHAGIQEEYPQGDFHFGRSIVRNDDFGKA